MKTIAVTIQALQWLGEEVEGFERKQVSVCEDGRPYYQLAVPYALGGYTYARPGEWIVKAKAGYYVFPESSISSISR